MKFINILMAPTSDQAAHSYKLRSPSPKTQQGHGVSAAVHTGSQLLPRHRLKQALKRAGFLWSEGNWEGDSFAGMELWASGDWGMGKRPMLWLL